MGTVATSSTSYLKNIKFWDHQTELSLRCWIQFNIFEEFRFSLICSSICRLIYNIY